MLSQRQRHQLLQRLFWNKYGSILVSHLVRYERMFDVVIRNYSLIGQTNGERWLLSLLDEEPLVFDVGFHDGASTREVLRARPKAQVVGFDPSRFAQGKHTEDFSADNRVRFEHLGLSDQEGRLTFYDYDNMCNSLAPRKESSDTPNLYEVPVTTLDAYCGTRGISHINFLKIDAEGFDLHVLEGAKGLLNKQGIDIFAFEFASGWAASKRYLWEAKEYMDALPYSLYHLFNGFLCPLVYNVRIDSSCTLPAMYVGLSENRSAQGDLPLRNYAF